MKLSIEDYIVLSYIAAHQSKLIFLFNWVWISLFMQLNVVWQLAPFTEKVVTGELPLYKVVIDNHSVMIKGNSILFNCSQGFTQNFSISQPSWILNEKNSKILKQNVGQLAPVYPTSPVHQFLFNKFHFQSSSNRIK